MTENISEICFTFQGFKKKSIEKYTYSFLYSYSNKKYYKQKKNAALFNYHLEQILKIFSAWKKIQNY